MIVVVAKIYDLLYLPIDHIPRKLQLLLLGVWSGEKYRRSKDSHLYYYIYNIYVI